ncbi:MAG: hypothetical protein RL497_2064 [Pseudomonadota bacterium]|jgi:integrase
MPLTDAAIKQAKPQENDFWLTDERGLRLLVKVNGSKYWRLKYRHDGKQKTLALGVYPEVTLKQARDKVSEAKHLLTEGQDPSTVHSKQAKNRQAEVADGSSFAAFAKDWWENQKGTWTADHAARVWRRLEMDAFPTLGHRAIHAIKTPDIIAVVKKIESRDALDVAQRVLQAMRSVFSYAVKIGQLESNPASDLAGVLKTRKTKHRDSLPREELPAFLRDLSTYEERGRTLTKLAIELLLLTFVRSQELRLARWAEFDLEAKLWRIPAERMKMKTEHLVPLSRQALGILEQLKEISAGFELVFPSERNRDDGMSDNTMRRAIFKMGYDGNTPGKSKAVPHGFRNTACSILNESNFNPDAIERQLSHVERNGVRAAYTHHARYMEERAVMMQWWADYLDTLRAQAMGANVVMVNFGKSAN